MTRPADQAQAGATLVVVLVMLVIVMLLGSSAAQIALQGEKMSRNDRDRQVAFQAAEAALRDAEIDLQNSKSSGSRSSFFSSQSQLGFPGPEDAVCGTTGNSQGLCRDDPKPAWLQVDFLETDESSAQSVPYGKFTGEDFPTVDGTLPARKPRYIIESKKYNLPGASADSANYFYRITAVGFGLRDSTRVMLQTFYRKED